MAGFEVRESLVDLKFPDVPQWAELRVSCSAISIGDLQEAATLAAIEHEHPDAGDMAKVARLYEAFAESLRSWNLTRDGQPIPADLGGVLSLEDWAPPPAGPGALNLIEAWIKAVAEHHMRQLAPDQVAATIAANAVTASEIG